MGQTIGRGRAGGKAGVPFCLTSPRRRTYQAAFPGSAAVPVAVLRA
jgi:hypothetical protein